MSGGVRLPEAPDPEVRPPVGDAAATFGIAVSFLAGLWLIMAPFALGYRTAGDFAPHWNTVLAGFAVAVCSLVHAMALRETPWMGPVLLVLGVWLVVAPSVELHAAAGRSPVNDVVTGAVVAVAALGSVVRTAARRRSRAARRPVHHRG
ncbi:SPW repeat domain-containing protein [Saccharothrix isguenensis]